MVFIHEFKPHRMMSVLYAVRRKQTSFQLFRYMSMEPVIEFRFPGATSVNSSILVFICLN